MEKLEKLDARDLKHQSLTKVEVCQSIVVLQRAMDTGVGCT